MKNDNIMDNKINQCFAFMLAILTTLIAIFLLSHVKNELNVDYILQYYNISIDQFLSENSEKLQYMIGTVLFPISYIIFHLLLGKYNRFNNINYSCMNNLGSFILIILTIILFIYQPFYLECFKYKNNVLISIIIALFFTSITITIMFIYNKIVKNAKIIDVLLLILSFVLILIVAKLYFTNTYYYNSIYVSYHFDAYFYPVYKVFSGETMLVDFNNLYGFYPYFLVPIFKLIGGISMMHFSFIMASLIFIILSSIVISIFVSIKNKVLAFVGAMAMCFILVLYSMLQGMGYYLQYVPHRILFPVLIILNSILIIKTINKFKRNLLILLGYIVSTISLLWNIDTGIVVITAYFLFHIYQLLIDYDIKDIILWKQLFKHIIYALISVVGSLIVLFMITYIRTGIVLDLADIMLGQKSFYGLGIGMLPMPIIHQWILLAGIYAVALVKAIRNIKFLRTEECNLSRIQISMYFMLPIIGMGIFVYFQGRSHLTTFISIIWPGIFLLIFFIQEFINSYKSISQDMYLKKLLYKIKIILLIFFVANYAGALVMNLLIPSRLASEKVSNKIVESSEISPLINEINKLRDGNEDIDIIAYNSAAIYCILGETDIVKIPATIDWFTKEDYKKVLDCLSKTKNKVIIDKKSFDLLIRYENQRTLEILNRFNVITDTDSYMSLQVK